jgi:curved DNA-binding protein CbpA
MDFYAVLGIPRDADEETIRSAYRILVRRYHPDRGSGSSPEKFRQVVEAYETLSERERRRAYDLSLSRTEPVITPPAEPFIPPVEPLIPPRLRFRQRWNPSAVNAPPWTSPYRPVYRFDELFGELIRSLEDDLFDPFRRG